MSVTAQTRNRGFSMSEEHKQNLAIGREHARVIREYLEALEGSQSRRGRRRTPESVERRLEEIRVRVDEEVDPLRRLQMISERESLEGELKVQETSGILPELEEAFVVVCRDYSQRKHISYSAWREAGVEAAVLKKAGVSR